MNRFRTLGIIPARGGSVGVPRKSIRLLAGRPLLEYTAKSSLAASRLDRVVLSTDDSEIAEVGKACGLDVPFLRPAELARDETPMLPVAQHVVEWVEKSGDVYEAICLLQPTNPFRAASDIDNCVELLESSGCDAVVSVLPVSSEHNPHWVFFEEPDGRLRLSTGEANPIARRQDLPPAFHRDGSVYAVRRDVLMNGKSLYGEHLLGFRMDPHHSINIDGPADWERAERILRSVKQPA